MKPLSSDSLALKRFKVLDLTRIRSGPTCVRILADFGAEVIRIESTFRRPGTSLDEDLAVYDELDALTQRNLALFQRAMEAAERASPRPINARALEGTIACALRRIRSASSSWFASMSNSASAT